MSDLQGFPQLGPSALIPDQPCMAVVSQHSPPEEGPVALEPPCRPAHWRGHIQGRAPLHAAW